MKKILITGASGFVGSHLVDVCLQRGYEVYAGIRKTSSTRYLENKRVQYFYIDFEDTYDLLQNLKAIPFDYIIHNAGATSSLNKEELFRINTGITKQFVTLVRESTPNLRKFIYISSLAAYGPADFTPGMILDKHALPNPVTSYGESKLASEKFIQSHTGFPYIIVRPTAIFGPRDKEFLRVFRTIKMGIAPLIGHQPQHLTFIYIKDFARLIEAMLSSDITEKSYFITDGNVYNPKTFNEFIAKALNKNIISLRIPVGLLRIVAGINEMYSKITKQSSVLNPEKLAELTAKSWECNIEPLRIDYNFTPDYPLDKAIQETADWYKEHQWI